MLGLVLYKMSRFKWGELPIQYQVEEFGIQIIMNIWIFLEAGLVSKIYKVLYGI